jgi:hypothetical protein
VFGCLGRLGCLIIIAVIAVAAWFTRGAWMPRVMPKSTASEVPATTAGGWQPISPAGSERARRAIESLGQRSGPVYVNLAPADLAAYVYQELSRATPGNASNVQAAVLGDQFYMRSDVALRDLKAAGALGPLAGMLGDRETLTLGGRIEMVSPGLAQYRLSEMKVKELALPRAAIPRLLRQLSRGDRPAGVAEDAIPLPIPRTIADIRVGRGMITLYKNVQ